MSEPDEDTIKRVAAAIRTEIDILLADYAGDWLRITGPDCDEQSPETVLAAQAKLFAIEWLRGTWTEKASTSDERLEGVARAALKAAEKRR